VAGVAGCVVVVMLCDDVCGAAGRDVAGGVDGPTRPRATVRVGAGAGFGAEGARSRITAERPTNPIVIAAAPYTIMFFSGGMAELERP
jgi:hypothetical protein